ncbi:hypothetical protein ACLB2K_022698 [Fragaria x ananassa]
MDKSWMLADRRSLRFQTGFENFLQFALANAADKSSIRCPCLKCCNHHEFTIGVIKGHVYFNGIMTNYRTWSLHGETSAREGNSDEESESVDMPEVEDGDESEGEEMSCDSDEFFRVVEDGDKALYPGCTKSTKLNALVEMFNLKAKHGMTYSCYSDWLMLFGSLLPDGNVVPNNLNEAKKTLSVLGMGYEKIHACPNDCILYRGDHHEAEICPECSTSRYKIGKNGAVRDRVPAKVLWYFPIISRFKKMFQSPKTAKALTWHADRKKDVMMRHPADSPT